VWSGDQLLLEYQTLVGTTFTPGTQPEQAAGTDTAADMRYQHWDLRSVRLVTEGSGAQVDTQSHDAFGGVMDGGASLTFFTTYEREQTGLDYAQARYYRSNHSRFTSPDSYRGSYLTGDSQSLNRFAYVGNDPINRTDPSGLEWICAEVDEEFGTGEEMYRIRWEKCNWKPESRGGNPRPCSDEGIRRIAERIQKDSTFKDDCHKMFAIMREAFNVCNSSTEAMDHLFNVLAGGGIGSSSVVFGQSGFKDIYQDRDPNSQNQVRHFIAWFYNGFFDDAPIVKMGAAWNRYQDRDNPEDLRLSNFGHYWGRRLRNVLNNPSSSGSLLDILDLLVLIEQRLCA
jgi:RHS repeat-associated protein